jgi:hypothetical protein
VKKANCWGGVQKNLTGNAQNIVSNAISGAAAVGLATAAAKIYQAANKSREFSEMMEVNPDLQEYQEQDPRKFNAHYNSLRRLNPGFAADPVISGTYMRRMSSSPQAAGTFLVESLQNRAGMENRYKLPLGGVTLSGDI